MNRDYPAPRSLSRNSSNSVSWGTKIKGAIQVGHGVGEAIRGSLGATDLGPHTGKYTSSGEIAQRGRHEIAQGMARMKGVTTMLPPAPVYDRRHSYPTQQYEQQQQGASAWGRRSASAHQHQHRQNPTTASSPFEKFYEHPYPAEQDQDPGFAGLGAGVDAGRRKEANDRIMPAFIMPSPHPSSALQTPYPPFAPQSRPVSSVHPSRSIAPSQLGVPGPSNPFPTSPHTSIAPPPPARNSLHLSSIPPSPLSSTNDAYHSVPSSTYHTAPSHTSFAAPPMSEPTPSNSRRRLSSLIDRTSKSIRLTGKGKGKAKEKQPEGGNKPGRIRSIRSRASVPDAVRPVYAASPPARVCSPPARIRARDRRLQCALVRRQGRVSPLAHGGGDAGSGARELERPCLARSKWANGPEQAGARAHTLFLSALNIYTTPLTIKIEAVLEWKELAASMKMRSDVRNRSEGATHPNRSDIAMAILPRRKRKLKFQGDVDGSTTVHVSWRLSKTRSNQPPKLK
ncbi:hypothetical protein C8R44DRAFT_845233 [Mycena epipterygia]|nr:hypothetical protein C8R44DRAFT_845233 [Mycena epipterygia]